jgi:hypothetical protein
MPRKDPLQAQRDLIHKIHTIGLPAAFEALVTVCKDPKAQASSKATAGTTLFRAGGLFDKDVQKGRDKPPEEMTAEELAAALAELRARMIDPDDDDEDDDDEDEDEDEGTGSPDDEEGESKDLFG